MKNTELKAEDPNSKPSTCLFCSPEQATWLSCTSDSSAENQERSPGCYFKVLSKAYHYIISRLICSLWGIKIKWGGTAHELYSYVGDWRGSCYCYPDCTVKVKAETRQLYSRSSWACWLQMAYSWVLTRIILRFRELTDNKCFNWKKNLPLLWINGKIQGISPLALIWDDAERPSWVPSDLGCP